MSATPVPKTAAATAKIACILVHYRYPEYTLACLKSLQEAGAESFKIFLVNNSASEGSGEELTEFLQKAGTEFAYFPTEENKGFGGGMNVI